jgi:hypothetical protein
MSRITISDLNTVNQVTELSEVELAATKGGFLFAKIAVLSYLFNKSKSNYGNNQNTCCPTTCH